MKKKVLVIVAHPDDETIWMGGILLRNKKNWQTTVLSLCRKEDSDRAPKFMKAGGLLGVKCIISDIDDEKMNDINIEEIKSRIISLIPTTLEYDIIFTHNNNGEYGHKRHIDTYNAVKELLKSERLKSKETFLFSYIKKENNYQGYCIYNSNADKLIRLNADEILEKKRLIKDVYGYNKGGFEELSCQEIESFDRFK